MPSSVRILCTKNWSNLARAQDELFHADWSGDCHNVSLECTWNVCWHCHLFVELRWPETEKTHEEHCCQRGPLCWPCLLNTEDSSIQIALTRRLVWQDHIAQLFGHSEQSGALILIDLLRSPKDQDQVTILDTNSIWQNLTMQGMGTNALLAVFGFGKSSVCLLKCDCLWVPDWAKEALEPK